MSRTSFCKIFVTGLTNRYWYSSIGLMKSKSKLDQERLRFEIRNMTYESTLYKLLKEELTKIGYWKNHKRGKPNPMFTRH